MSTASEAGMYAATYRIMTWMLILATTIAVGCRGAQKFGRNLQVRTSNDVEVAEIDSPEQRLATSTRADGESEQSKATPSMNNMHKGVVRVQWKALQAF